GLKKSLNTFSRRPGANAIARNLGKIEPVLYPDGTFGPLESCCHSLKLCSRWNDVVNRRVQPVQLKRSRHDLVVGIACDCCADCCKSKRADDGYHRESQQGTQRDSLHDTFLLLRRIGGLQTWATSTADCSKSSAFIFS